MDVQKAASLDAYLSERREPTHFLKRARSEHRGKTESVNSCREIPSRPQSWISGVRADLSLWLRRDVVAESIQDIGDKVCTPRDHFKVPTIVEEPSHVGSFGPIVPNQRHVEGMNKPQIQEHGVPKLPPPEPLYDVAPPPLQCGEIMPDDDLDSEPLYELVKEKDVSREDSHCSSGSRKSMAPSLKDRMWGPRSDTRKLVADSMVTASLSGRQRSGKDTSEQAGGSMPPGRSVSMADRLQKVVSSTWFMVISLMVVIMHSLFLGIDTDLDLGEGPRSTAFIVDASFAAWYTLEATVRLGAARAAFFLNGWNLLDVGLLCLSIVELSASAATGVKVWASFRLIRLLRIARLARLFRFIKPLWLLTLGILTSMQMVVWAWLLMGVLIYIFGLCFVQTLAPYTCGQWDESEQNLEELEMYFGSVGRSLFTVFQCVTMESWIRVADLATAQEPMLFPIFFLLFLTTSWGVMQVVVAVFVNSTLEASSVRSMEAVRVQQASYEDACRKMVEVFRIADQNSDDTLSRFEFMKAFENPEVSKLLHEAGIDNALARELFDILDLDGSTTLDGAEFVEGALRSVGQAQNKHVISLRCDVCRASLSMEDEILRASSFIKSRMEATLVQLDALRTEAGPVLQGACASLSRTCKPLSRAPTPHGSTRDISGKDSCSRGGAECSKPLWKTGQPSSHDCWLSESRIPPAAQEPKMSLKAAHLCKGGGPGRGASRNRPTVAYSDPDADELTAWELQ